MVKIENVVNLNNCSISSQNAQFMIDEAMKRGIRRSDLRWLVTSEQRRMIRRSIEDISDQARLRVDYEHGAGQESGMFLGVPYAVRDDIQLRRDVIVLEVVTDTERIGMMEGCAVDRWAAGA